MSKIAFISGSRAEWGLLEKVYRAVDAFDHDKLLFVTGSHLALEYGETWRHIDVPITDKIECVVSAHTPSAVTLSMALATVGFGLAFKAHRPDLVVVLGDRYEIFAAVSAAHVAGIPVAHIHGGELTEGSLDDGFRHCITKLSHLHFTAAEEYGRRVVQLGEHPSTVYPVGALGADGLTRRENHEPTNFYIVAHYGSPREVDDIEKVLNARGANFVVAQGSHDIQCYLGRKDAYVVLRETYLKDLAHADAIIGNSSSGIIEAPAMGVPTINIGDRQKGRLIATSIIHCATVNDLPLALDNLHSDFFKKIMASDYYTPYRGGDVAGKIAGIIHGSVEVGIPARKGFYDQM